MAKDFSQMEDANRSRNANIHEVSDPQRRVLLKGGASLAASSLFAPLMMSGCSSTATATAALSQAGRHIGFTSVPMNKLDQVTVPDGYVAQVLYRWGDPAGLPGNMPEFKYDASNNAEEQAAQAGMHHDGMAYFPLDGHHHGLLAINHEYIDDGLLHPDGTANWQADKVRKAMAAHGVSVVEVVRNKDGWDVVRPSRFARRITANTPMTLSGPAAGHRLMQTAADPGGTTVLGTFANCANGFTPWGTYLTCEENFANYFEGPSNPDTHQQRWSIAPGNSYRWHEHEPRFDTRQHPNEPNRFGWVVEIDPLDPSSTPVKRTALGRAAHEGAAVALTRDGRAVVYMGEDARFEYIYKFVSRDRMQPGGAAANRHLLDHGTLYVARFDADGRGRWLPLRHGQGALTPAQGFADQGEVLIKSRQASDLLGATRMDRPEWTTIDPLTHEVYCSLTNNHLRGQAGHPIADAANPRSQNTMGHIIRWKEDQDLDGDTFTWTHFVLAGDPSLERADAQGNIRGDTFGSPDGLRIDPRGVLWIQTDVSTSTLGKGDYVHLSNNQMLACDPTQGTIRRFLVGPRGCELTGIAFAPDLRTIFVNIQHPGEPASERSDPNNPTKVSSWPDGRGRPRSATVAIYRQDGGIIGT